MFSRLQSLIKDLPSIPARLYEQLHPLNPFSRRNDHSPVSLTGRFTGHVWVANRLAPNAFDTRSGALMYQALRPLDQISASLMGVDLETMLLQRHRLLDELCAELIRLNDNLQILEIGCGLSARAYRLLREFPKSPIRYVEADLPSVAKHKRRLLQSQGYLDARHQILPCNILREEGPLSPEALLANLDPRLPVLIINEGLVNYFPLEQMQAYWRRLRKALNPFPQGIYLAEIWPRLPQYRGLPARKAVITLIETLTQQDVPLHFDDDNDIQRNFRQLGFADVHVINPDEVADFYQLPSMAKPTLFRVLRAIVQHPSP